MVKINRSLLIITATLLSAALLLLSRSYAQNVIGRISGVKGEVVITEIKSDTNAAPGDTEKRAARIFDSIYDTNIITVPGDGFIRIIFTSDGHEEMLQGACEAGFKDNATDLRNGPPESRSVTRKPPRVTLPVNRSVAGRSICGNVSRNTYIPATVDYSRSIERPTFRWISVEDHTFSFELEESGGRGTAAKKLLSRESLKNGILEYPSDAPSLEPGKRYQCRISLTYQDSVCELKDNYNPPWIFTLPTREELNFIADEEKKLAKMNEEDPERISRMIFLLDYYIEFGLNDRARPVVTELYRKNPGNEVLRDYNWIYKML